MSKRVSSRDDLFLSAADLYLLLSFLFLGLAFIRLPAIGSERGALDLPELQRGVSPLPREKTFRVDWTDSSRNPQNLAGSCQIAILDFPDSIKGIIPSSNEVTVPCTPLNYAPEQGTTATALDELSAIASSLELGKRNAIVICRRPVPGEPAAASLLACARLQWLMAEAGFKPMAEVKVGGEGR